MTNATQELPFLQAPNALDRRPQVQGRWIQTLTHLDPRYGGLSAAVPQMGSKLALAEKFSIGIAAFCGDDDRGALSQYPELSLTRWPKSRVAWLRRRELREQFRNLLGAGDAVHIHGLWEGSTSISARGARLLKKPYIVSAHGMLEPWALANKGWKKRIYAALVESNNIEGAACLHALTAAEAKDYRRFGSRRPIAVIPNGVDLPPSTGSALFLEKFPRLAGKRIVLFLGRIHFKKGLDILVEAWSRLGARFPDAVLVLAGPDSENSRAPVENLIAAHGLKARVFFTGMLAGEMKWSALASSHCFVLPSYSEGLSVAALEAMSMGLPVIVTQQCHLPEIEELDAGWEIQANTKALAGALEDMLGNRPATNALIGEQGRRIVQQRYSWPVVARQMAELYRWVQGGAAPHSFEILEVKP